jgi:glycosyltransferase involved in cell wall biosynthesis
MQTSLLAAVVPVFNPERGLLDLCRELCEKFHAVIVVDDGSFINTDDFLSLPSKCELVRHETNKGKGAAIKSAISYIKKHHPEITVMVCCDGDGQHRPSDAVKVANTALESSCVTLGVRNVDRKGIPLRSRFGNVLTSFLVRLIYRIPIKDTQTGLRAIPSRLFDVFLQLSGERYEYEMRLFGLIKSFGEKLQQVPIKTIYIEENRASHFRPIVDSVRVYWGLFVGTFFKFCTSSIFGFIVDNLVFTLVLFSFNYSSLPRRYSIFAALVTSCAVSATANYLINKFFVFRSGSSVVASYLKYWALVLVFATLSYVQTALISALLDANGYTITIIKILVETFLFVVSYKFQKKWVF